MRFRLIYEGELKSTQGAARGGQTDRKASHKHRLRRVFHQQLKHLWQNNAFLREHKATPQEYLTPARLAGGAAVWGFPENEQVPVVGLIAKRYASLGYDWVPLVTDHWNIQCRLHVLLLRPETPGGLFGSAGDIDNKVKTIVDALRIPQSGGEMFGVSGPEEGESPFFCLLEDDKLVTSLSVETDTLLTVPMAGSEEDRRHVKAMITVEIVPTRVTLLNISLA